METQLATDPNRFTQDLFDGLPRRYDRLAEVLSFGQNGRWRRAMVDRVVAGEPRSRARRRHRHRRRRAAARRAHATPTSPASTSRPRCCARAAHACARRGATSRIALVAGNAEVLPFPDASFDALTFTYLLRYVHDPAATIRELARVLKPGAPMASLDFAVPTQPAVAVVVVVLHPACCSRSAGCSAGGLGAGRPLPRPEHHRLLRAPPGFDDRQRVGERRHGRRREPGDEPGWRARDVGHQVRRPTP